jgi:type I restriction enzyme R subunit
VATHARERFLTAEEVVFSDALAANESAVKAMGIPEMKVIAAELVTQACKGVTIDWTVREGGWAKIKVIVNRTLKKHCVPPDLQDEAIKMVLAQAELLPEWLDWVDRETVGGDRVEPTREIVSPKK